MKWGFPCYTFRGKNVVLIHGFRDYCALLIFKGALLDDPRKILVRQTRNVQAGRHIRFSRAEDIRLMSDTLKSYIKAAVEVERKGLKVPMKETSEFSVPGELQSILSEMPELKTAFDRLSPGRKRAYLLYFSEPKQSKTRVSRIHRYMDKILEGKGLND